MAVSPIAEHSVEASAVCHFDTGGFNEYQNPLTPIRQIPTLIIPVQKYPYGNRVQGVRKVLYEQFEAAVRRRDLALALLTEGDLPDALRHTDGTQRIISSARDYRDALMEVSNAVQRIADFQIRGIAPDGLKQSGGESTGQIRLTPQRFTPYSRGETLKLQSPHGRSPQVAGGRT
jgi:hypothetical protein